MSCTALAANGWTPTPSDSGNATGSDASVSAEPSATGAVLMDHPVYLVENYACIIIAVPVDEFNKLGFAYGDSVEIEFSNGFALTVPYYNGYYGDVGDRMLVAYPGHDFLTIAENAGASMWEVAGVSEGDTVTITLAEPGAYADVQESFNITWSNERSDYPSDEAFANFRSLAGGTMAPDFVYRSASPIDDKHNRVAYVERLMAEANVRFVLALSEDDAEIDKLLAKDAEKGLDTSYYERLRETGNVVAIKIGTNYPSVSYAQKLASGLVALSEHDGPYLMHCVEGRDRTGFSCMLLGALAGATYDEMLADYMATFDNYYHINKQNDPARFETIASTNFDSMLRRLPGMEHANVHEADLVEPARAYLRMGGMSDRQIDTLVARITVKG